MGTTISRRLVFVKMKRKPPPPPNASILFAPTMY